MTSMSPSGRPFLTPSGHRPAWSSSASIRWARGDAFDPSTYRKILTGEDAHPGSAPASSSSASPVTAVVSTIGILLEANYKGPSGSWEEVGKALARGWGLERQNPLEANAAAPGMYERMNRDAVLAIAETFVSTRDASSAPSPFVFISAEDIFRPIIDGRYLSTKREAEAALERMSWAAAEPAAASMSSPPSPPDAVPDSDGAGLESEINSRPPPPPSPRRILRPTFLRPGLMYHPHTRPISTLPSALLDLSANIHASLPGFFPTPAGLLQSLGQDSLARLLRHSPLHIDTVAKAASEAIARDNVSGPVGIEGIKALAGFKSSAGAGGQAGFASASASSSSASASSPAEKKPWPTQQSCGL